MATIQAKKTINMPCLFFIAFGFYIILIAGNTATKSPLYGGLFMKILFIVWNLLYLNNPILLSVKASRQPPSHSDLVSVF